MGINSWVLSQANTKRGVTSTGYFTSSNRELSASTAPWCGTARAKGQLCISMAWPSPSPVRSSAGCSLGIVALQRAPVGLFGFMELWGCVCDVQYSLTWLFTASHGSPGVSGRSCFTASWQQLSQENGKVWQREICAHTGVTLTITWMSTSVTAFRWVVLLTALFSYLLSCKHSGFFPCCR